MAGKSPNSGGRSGPGSGSKKKEKNGARNSSNPWFAVKATGGVALAAVLLSALGASSWWKRASNADQANQALVDAVEKLQLLNSKVELQEKMQHLGDEERKLLEDKRRAEEEKAKLEQAIEGETAGPGLGPSVMAAQSKLIGRLLELAQEVEALSGDDKREERLAASQRVEAELAELEKSSTAPAGSAVAKQQAALIALVRSALQSDRDGGELPEGEDWSEEGLRKKHGLVTYASQAYWDEAYAHGSYGETFDWYGAWEESDVNGKSLRDFVLPLVAEDARILVLGCGNSNMSALMHGDGFHRITSVDISEKVIDQMRERHAHLPSLEWQALDASSMGEGSPGGGFAAGSFDFVVEKGLFDALYAGTGERVRPVLSEVQRVLKPGGRLVSVSFSSDRVDRLFSGKGEEGDEAADAAASAASRLSGCRVTGELAYRKARRDDEETNSSKAVYVYDCERSP